MSAPPDDPPGDAHGSGHRVPVTVPTALGAVLWTILAQFLVLPLFVLDGSPPTGVELAVSVLVVVAVTLAGLAGILAATGAWSVRVLGRRPPRVRDVGTGIGVGLVGFVLATLTTAALNALLGGLEPPSQVLLEATRDARGLVVVLVGLAAVVGAPLVEELVFRGLLFEALRRRAGLLAGLVGSGAVFAAVHLELQWTFQISLLVLGVWLAWAFHRTGSLVVPIVGHATFNGTSLALALLVGA